MRHCLINILKICKRELPSEHFQQSASKGPYICKSAIPSLSNHFRGHSIWRPAQRQLLLSTLNFEELRAAKVCQFANSLIVNKYIGAFDIPV